MRMQMGDFQKMRLYNMYFLCKQCRQEISDLSFNDTNKLNVFLIDNWDKYKGVLFVIRQVPILKMYVDDFYETVPVFVREKPLPEIDLDIKNKLIIKKIDIVQMMDTVISLYESMGLSGDTEGIDVKIPPCDSLDQYISYLKEIDFIFTQCPFLQHEDGTIKFNTVDVGSQWITFLVYASTGTAAVTYIFNNLATLIDKAVQVKSHLKNLEQQKEIIRTQNLQNNVLETNLEIFDSLRKHYLSQAVSEIENENPDTPLKDGEERAKVEKSIEKLCGLLDKGVEIYASIDTDHEIQVLFPAMEDKAELPDSIMKYIEEKNGE